MHLAHLVDHAGVKQDALGDRGLARIDVRGDTDITCSLERKFTLRRIRIRGNWLLFHRRRRHKITSGNAQKRGSPAPFCACLRVS